MPHTLRDPWRRAQGDDFGMVSAGRGMLLVHLCFSDTDNAAHLPRRRFFAASPVLLSSSSIIIHHRKRTIADALEEFILTFWECRGQDTQNGLWPSKTVPAFFLPTHFSHSLLCCGFRWRENSNNCGKSVWTVLNVSQLTNSCLFKRITPVSEWSTRNKLNYVIRFGFIYSLFRMVPFWSFSDCE